MNWKKILSNVGGSVVAAVAATYAVFGMPSDAASWKAFAVAVALAIFSNQLGLHQAPPSAGK